MESLHHRFGLHVEEPEPERQDFTGIPATGTPNSMASLIGSFSYQSMQPLLGQGQGLMYPGQQGQPRSGINMAAHAHLNLPRLPQSHAPLSSGMDQTHGSQQQVSPVSQMSSSPLITSQTPGNDNVMFVRADQTDKAARLASYTRHQHLPTASPVLAPVTSYMATMPLAGPFYMQRRGLSSPSDPDPMAASFPTSTMLQQFYMGKANLPFRPQGISHMSSKTHPLFLDSLSIPSSKVFSASVAEKQYGERGMQSHMDCDLPHVQPPALGGLSHGLSQSLLKPYPQSNLSSCYGTPHVGMSDWNSRSCSMYSSMESLYSSGFGEPDMSFGPGPIHCNSPVLMSPVHRLLSKNGTDHNTYVSDRLNNNGNGQTGLESELSLSGLPFEDQSNCMLNGTQSGLARLPSLSLPTDSQAMSLMRTSSGNSSTADYNSAAIDCLQSPDVSSANRKGENPQFVPTSTTENSSGLNPGLINTPNKTVSNALNSQKKGLVRFFAVGRTEGNSSSVKPAELERSENRSAEDSACCQAKVSPEEQPMSATETKSPNPSQTPVSFLEETEAEHSCPQYLQRNYPIPTCTNLPPAENPLNVSPDVSGMYTSEDTTGCSSLSLMETSDFTLPSLDSAFEQAGCNAVSFFEEYNRHPSTVSSRICETGQSSIPDGNGDSAERNLEQVVSGDAVDTDATDAHVYGTAEENCASKTCENAIKTFTPDECMTDRNGSTDNFFTAGQNDRTDTSTNIEETPATETLVTTVQNDTTQTCVTARQTNPAETSVFGEQDSATEGFLTAENRGSNMLIFDQTPQPEGVVTSQQKSKELKSPVLMQCLNKSSKQSKLDVKVTVDESQCILVDGKVRWQCNLCQKSYTSRNNLSTHILDHRGIKTHRCQTCGQLFKQRSHLNSHMLTHNKSKPHLCPVCGRGFTQATHLKRHQVKHTALKPHVCDSCQRGFTYHSDLKAHKNRYKNKKCVPRIMRYDSAGGFKSGPTEAAAPEVCCKRCHKVVKSSQLTDHMSTHDDVRPFVCGQCGLDFVKEHHLRAHQFTHTGIKPFKCATCGRGFNQKANMERHMLIHNVQRGFVCKVCGKTFTQPQVLKAHQVVHAEKKPFQCHLCGKEFTRLHNLQGHMHMHDNTKPYICFCGTSFTLRGNLNRHKKVKHGLSESTACMEEGAVQLLKSLSKRAREAEESSKRLTERNITDLSNSDTIMAEDTTDIISEGNDSATPATSDSSAVVADHCPRKQRKSTPRKVISSSENQNVNQNPNKKKSSRIFTTGVLGLQEMSPKLTQKFGQHAESLKSNITMKIIGQQTTFHTDSHMSPLAQSSFCNRAGSDSSPSHGHEQLSS